MLDRMIIEEAGPNPDKTAFEIHRQLGFDNKAVDLSFLASELDILEVKYECLTNVQGILATDPNRSNGVIYISKYSSPQRQRFTLAHELGHYFNPWHKMPVGEGFWCVENEMGTKFSAIRKSMSPFEKQEVEANRFASELLMPRRQIKRSLSSHPDFYEILDLAHIYNVSKEAMARRYVDLHSEDLAIVFSKDGQVRYSIKGGNLKSFFLGKGDPLPWVPPVQNNMKSISSKLEGNWNDWLIGPQNGELFIQHHQQNDGFAVTLLHTPERDDGDDGVEDVFDRFARF